MHHGSYKITAFNDEEVKAYIPPNLEEILQYIDIDSNRIGKVSYFLGKLDAICDVLPETNLFIYLYVRKEALLSSQIEGTQSSLIDVFSYENYKVNEGIQFLSDRMNKLGSPELDFLKCYYYYLTLAHAYCNGLKSVLDKITSFCFYKKNK